MDPDGVGEGIALVIPDVLEEVLRRNDGRTPTSQILQNGELSDGQDQRPTVEAGRQTGGVKDQAPDAQGGFPGGDSPPQQGSDAGREFFEGKGLDQVVVGPGIQTQDPISDPIPGREHEDGRTAARGPQATANLDPVYVRKAQVENDNVVGGQPGGEALASQGPGQRLGQFSLIFDVKPA